MASWHLSGRRDAVHPLAGLADHRRRHDPAGVRSVGVRDATAARSLPARHVAVGLATLAAAGLQPDAARRRRRHQFLLAAVCRFGVDRVAPGAGRRRALGRIADRLCRRADRDQSGRQFADARRAVRAGQRHHVRQRHGRGARHDAHGIGQHAGDLAIDRAGVLSQFFAVFRLALADALDAALLFGTGFTNAVGQWFWTKALHLAPAAAVTPFYYLMLVWSLIIGFLV